MEKHFNEEVEATKEGDKDKAIVNPTGEIVKEQIDHKEHSSVVLNEESTNIISTAQLNKETSLSNNMDFYDSHPTHFSNEGYYQQNSPFYSNFFPLTVTSNGFSGSIQQSYASQPTSPTESDNYLMSNLNVKQESQQQIGEYSRHQIIWQSSERQLNSHQQITEESIGCVNDSNKLENVDKSSTKSCISSPENKIEVQSNRIDKLEKSYKCEYCGKFFSQSQNLIVHRRIHTGEKPYKCDICQKAFTHKSNLNVHRKIHNNGTKTENNCDISSNCPMDPMGFVTTSYSLTAINENESKTEKPYKCEYCGKFFTQSQNLIVHRRIHTGEKPYKCDICQKAFTHKSNLNVHKRTHSGEKPFTCSSCEKTFSDKSGLINHNKIHEKPFQCLACDKSFTGKNDLRQHKNMHFGLKFHKCLECDKTFANNSNLIIHRRIHTGEKPYNCEVCHKSFRHNSNLVVHRKIHTGMKLTTSTEFATEFKTIVESSIHQ